MIATGRRGLTPSALLAPVLACGGTPPVDPAPPDPPVATRLEVLPSAVTLFALGDEALLTTRILDQRGRVLAGEAVAWSTDDPAVATVDGTAVEGSGLVTAAGNGATTVTAASGSLEGVAAVAVAQRAAAVEAPPAPDTLRRYGDTVRVAMRAFDGNGHPAPSSALAWTTSDSSVAVVDETGLVTAAGNGSATISAVAGQETAAVEVVVHDREAEDREVLLILYGDVSGPGWLTWGGFRRWDPSKSISTWWGVTTEEEGRATRVVELSLPDASFRGPLPRELGRLGSLRVLHLQGNSIEGVVPREVGMLPHLESLRLDRTRVEGLEGPYPSLEVLNLAETRIGTSYHVGHLPNLRSLDLSRNELYVFPTGILGHPKLEVLDLSFNRMVGHIPPELGDLATLRVLRLGGNYRPGRGGGGWGLEGPIPPELGRLANLEELWLGRNRLTGRIPPELGNLAKLRSLHLGGDHSHNFRGVHLGLEGPVPPELGKLANLEELGLSMNQLTGPISPELSNLNKLMELWLDGNQLTGSILPELGSLSDLERLDLSRNELSGAVPPELGRLGKLTRLDLSSTKVSGPMPEAFGDLASLEVLFLGSTRMSGPLPRAATRMTSLRTLSMVSTLCVPRDSAFDAWVEGIMWFTGTRCRN